MYQRFKGSLLVIVSAVVFGLNPILAKAIYIEGGNAITLAFFRMLFGAISLWLISRFFVREPIIISFGDFKKIFLCSIGYCATPILLFTSYNFLSSGMSTTIHFVYPVIVLIGCIVFFHDRPTLIKSLCCVLCTLGIFSFYTPGGSVSLFGIVIAFISGCTYAFYIMYYSHSGLKNMPAFKLGFWLCAISTVEVGIVASVSGQLTLSNTPMGWILTVIFALMCTCIATICFQVGTRLIGPQSASLLSTFEPLTSVIVGVLLYHEDLTIRISIGICMILVSVILLSREKN